MGADAYREIPVYRAEVDKCAEAFVAAGIESPLPYLLFDTGLAEWPQTQTQAAQFTHAAGLQQVWKSCGILPDITVGHSLGEIGAAYVAGAITLADAVAVVIARAQVVDGLPGRYGMAVLGISADDAERLIAATPGWLELSVVNSGSSVVVSGDREAVKAIVAAADDRGLFAREIAVNFPAHTSALEPLREDLIARLPRSTFAETPVQFIGSATASVVAPGTDFADYWYRNLRNTVRFDRAVATAVAHGAGSFVELSAHPALLFALGDLVGDGPGEPPLTVGSGRRDEPLVDELSANIAAAAVADAGYRWADLVDLSQPPLPGFPNAPMHAVHLWATPEPLPPIRRADRRRRKVGCEARIRNCRSACGGSPCSSSTGPAGPLAGPLRNAIEVTRQHASRSTRMTPTCLSRSRPSSTTPTPNWPPRKSPGCSVADCSTMPTPSARPVATSGSSPWVVSTSGPTNPWRLPAQAALAAMHRSIGFEHSDQTFRHLDLPSWDVDDAAVIVDTLLGDCTEAALRDSDSGPTLYARTLPELEQAAEPWQLDAGLLDNVVITGGSGAVGLHFARYLAGRGARRIVLLSRGGVDPAAVGMTRSRRGDPAMRRDISRPGAGRGARTRRRRCVAGDPCRRVRRASAPATRSHLRRSPTLSPPRWWAWPASAELWPLRPDARILVCSSISGVWGGRGHAAYSAANRMLDVMAGQLRAKGQHCVAAKYGLWGAGIVDADEVAQIERSGLLPMVPDAAIEASLRDHPSDPLILAADRDRLRTFFDSRSAAETDSGTAASGIDTGCAGACGAGGRVEPRRRRHHRPFGITARFGRGLAARAGSAQAAAPRHRQIGSAGRPARRHHRRRADRQPRNPRQFREGGHLA